MITKERLEELAYKGARLYSVDINHKTIFSFNIHYGLNGDFTLTDDHMKFLVNVLKVKKKQKKF